MSATGAGYDLSTTTFSPDGRVFQVEYASKAVEKSGTAIGIRCKDGVVLGVEKLLQARMLVRKSNRRIHNIDTHVGVAVAGMAADARQIVNRGRQEAESYRNIYGSQVPGRVLGERLAGFVHAYTLYWYLRPFGCAAIVASYDEEQGPVLQMIEPAGINYRYFAAAVGKHQRGAKSELEKLNFQTITAREAVKEVARIIYKLHDDIKDKEFEVEISWVCDESKRKHVFVPDDLFQEAVAAAQSAKNKEEMDSEDEA